MCLIKFQAAVINYLFLTFFFLYFFFYFLGPYRTRKAHTQIQTLYFLLIVVFIIESFFFKMMEVCKKDIGAL